MLERPPLRFGGGFSVWRVTVRERAKANAEGAEENAKDAEGSFGIAGDAELLGWCSWGRNGGDWGGGDALRQVQEASG